MPKPTSVASVADAAYMEAVTLPASGLDAVDAIERLHDRDPELAYRFMALVEREATQRHARRMCEMDHEHARCLERWRLASAVTALLGVLAVVVVLFLRGHPMEASLVGVLAPLTALFLDRRPYLSHGREPWAPGSDRRRVPPPPCEPCAPPLSSGAAERLADRDAHVRAT